MEAIIGVLLMRYICGPLGDVYWVNSLIKVVKWKEKKRSLTVAIHVWGFNKVIEKET